MRRSLDLWNFGELDAFFDLYDQDAECITDPSWTERGPYRGREAIRAWYEGFLEAYSETTSVVTELYESAGTVVARWDWHTVGRATHLESTLDVTALNRIEGGRIVRQRYFFDHAEAIAALEAGW